MSIDRKKLVCFVVSAKNVAGEQLWCALNEDREWLSNLEAEPAGAAEKAGVYCCSPSEEVRRAAATALGVDAFSDIVAHRLFQTSDSDECAAVISRRALS